MFQDDKKNCHTENEREDIETSTTSNEFSQVCVCF
jgi:hypothetical protein